MSGDTTSLEPKNSKRLLTGSLGSNKSPSNSTGKNFLNKFLKKKSPPNQSSSSNHSSKPKTRQRSSSSKSRYSNFDRSYIDKEDLSLFGDLDGGEGSDDASDNDDTTASLNSSMGSSIMRTTSTLSNDKNINDDTTENLDFKMLESTRSSMVDDGIPDFDLFNGIKKESLFTPKYLKGSKRKKSSPKILKRLFLSQELNNDSDDENSFDSESLVNLETDDNSDGNQKDDILNTNPQRNQLVGSKMRKEIFVMQFSRDGKYLAVAGRDSVIKVWKVICSPLGRMEYNNMSSKKSKKSKDNDPVFEYAPVFHQKPVRVFKGHKSSVLTLDWSKNDFLISGSMDRTVKLWHVERPDYLASFQHEDFVTTVKFHPNDDRFFLSGSLDNNCRLWSVLERMVVLKKHLGDNMLITASAFTPDSLFCLFGGFNGKVVALETKGLHIVNEFDIKRLYVNNLNKEGNKVTSIKIFSSGNEIIQPSDPYSRWSFLITTNDSKIRLVNSHDKKLVTRFKGITNTGSIEASISHDFKYVLSGSEDHWCYIWENNNTIINNKVKLALQNVVIEGKNHINDMQHKHKKYYDLLINRNKLVKKLNVGQFLKDPNVDIISNENNSYTCFHAHHSTVNAAIFAPYNTKKLLELSDDVIFDLRKKCKSLDIFYDSKEKSGCDDPEEEINGTENEGYIIVTTDEFGLIRVYRHDPVYQLRKKLVQQFAKKNNSKNNDVKLQRLNSMSKRLHSRSLSPGHSTDFKNKFHNKMRPGDSLSVSNPSSNLVPTVSTTPSKTSNRNSMSKYPTAGADVTIRPGLKSFSHSIIHGEDASLDIRTQTPKSKAPKSKTPTLGELNEQVKGVHLNSHAITPDKELETPFPIIGKDPGSNNSEKKTPIPLIVNTKPQIGSEDHDSEIVDFKTPTGRDPNTKDVL